MTEGRTVMCSETYFQFFKLVYVFSVTHVVMNIHKTIAMLFWEMFF